MLFHIYLPALTFHDKDKKQFRDNSYNVLNLQRELIVLYPPAHSIMWSKSFMYSVLVKDYHCILTFAYIVPRKLY